MTLLAALLLAAPVATPAPADGGAPAAVSAVDAGADGGQAAAQVYKFGDPKRRDTVRFTIDGPFLEINGVGSDLEGELKIIEGKASGELKLSVASIRTGDASRDSHLRGEQWLEAKAHPYLTFTFKDLELPEAKATKEGEKISLKAKGEFELKGVKHDEPVEIVAVFVKQSEQSKVRLDGDLVHVQAKAKLRLDHFKLEARKKMPQEVGEQAEVALDAWGSTKP